jgi:hypothetical protein
VFAAEGKDRSKQRNRADPHTPHRHMIHGKPLPQFARGVRRNRLRAIRSGSKTSLFGNQAARFRSPRPDLSYLEEGNRDGLLHRSIKK